MKIQTILEIIDTQVSTVSSSNKFKQEKNDAARKRLGSAPQSGFFGRVHNGNDPHTVHKIPFDPTPENKDGYYKYIKYIVETKLYDTNPYAPRIYKFKTIKDANNNIKYKIELEKLVSLRTVDAEIVREIGIKIAGEQHFLELTRYFTNIFNSSKYMPQIVVAKTIEEIIKGKLHTNDEYLQQICNIIRKIADTTSADIDVHFGNIMVRRSPYPQLVIVDPLT